MGMNVTSASKGGRGGRRKFAPVAEINVTPMVDVMLVLLIIFMITAPLLTVGIPVDLPKTQASSINESQEPLTITVNKAGQIYIQETEVELDAVVPRLVAITGSNSDTRIFVRGDQNVPYGDVIKVMGAINSAGFKKVALLSEAPNGPAV